MALALGKSLTELRETMSVTEWREWAVFFRLYPFGPKQEDKRAGIVASEISRLIAAWGGKYYQPDHWFPSLDRTRVPRRNGKLGASDVIRALGGDSPAYIAKMARKQMEKKQQQQKQ